MTEVTEKDFEVREKDVTKYKCDNCGSVVTGEDAFLYIISSDLNGSRYGEGGKGHLCSECVERERYATLKDIADLKVSIADKINLISDPAAVLVASGAVSGIAIIMWSFYWTTITFPSQAGGTAGGAIFLGLVVGFGVAFMSHALAIVLFGS